MSKILVVDDEIKIRNVLKEYIEFSGHTFFGAEDGRVAVEAQKQHSCDIIIMDIMMPHMDGFTAVSEIRKFSNAPILMLSARGEEYDKLRGFELGIDDYVQKPFSPKEIMARVSAILKRHTKVEDLFTYNGLIVDFIAHRVIIDNNELVLTPKEYDLLFYFIRNRGVALSREQLLNKVWGYDYYGDDRTLDTYIKMLRQNLGEYRELIVTLRGLGYRFEV